MLQQRLQASPEAETQSCDNGAGSGRARTSNCTAIRSTAPPAELPIGESKECPVAKGPTDVEREEQERGEEIGLQILASAVPAIVAAPATTTGFSFSPPWLEATETTSGERSVNGVEEFRGSEGRAGESTSDAFSGDPAGRRAEPGAGIPPLSAHYIGLTVPVTDPPGSLGLSVGTGLNLRQDMKADEKAAATGLPATSERTAEVGIAVPPLSESVAPPVVQGRLQQQDSERAASAGRAVPVTRLPLNSAAGPTVAGLPANSENFARELPPDGRELGGNPGSSQGSGRDDLSRLAGSPTGVEYAVGENQVDSDHAPSVLSADGRRPPREPAYFTAAREPAAVESDGLAASGLARQPSRESGRGDSASADHPESDLREVQPGNPTQRVSVTAPHDSSAAMDPHKAREAGRTDRNAPSTTQAEQLASAKAALSKPSGPRTALRELTVRLEAGTGRRVDMQFVEARGAVNLKLRTHDQQIADTLRVNISQLESDLNTRGWKAELSPSADSLKRFSGTEDADRLSPAWRTAPGRGQNSPGSLNQTSMGSGEHSDSPRREWDWSSDEQELAEMAALRRLAVKGGLK